MNWDEIFGADQIPSHEDIREYLSEARSNWDELTAYLEEAYQVKPQIAYSKCSAQPGWNVKYKKSGKSLCTLYPLAGWFIALVVVGPKEEEEVRTGMATGWFTTGVQELYQRTADSALGRWLMIEVRDQAVLADIQHLLGVRVRPKSITV